MRVAKMEKEVLKESKSELQIEVESTVRRNQHQIIIKLKAPKDYFLAGEFLSKYQKFETPESFLKTQLYEVAKSYLEKAKEAISTIQPKI